MSLARKAVNVVVTADSICPFCYLGYTKLNKAVATAKSKNLPLDITVRFVPYQLDPSLPTTYAVSKRDHYQNKFGAARFAQMEPFMQSRFASEGLSITYEGMLRQTTLSHRLIAKAFHVGGESLQQRVIEEVYKTYFSQGKDIGDVAVLAPIAAQTGVFKDEEQAKAWLEGSEGVEEYERGILEAQNSGISGVPFFKINDKWAISGAQDTELFVSVFERIASGKLI
ncbi:SubName: Full=Uncharacterized protein {ECO:0000313/EMBL:CCA74670.1} [Serendipita indica DSM 11827]|uniref:DSBA-like thioredoxin domain-containing protein n=1 Tax=Serendipita indica (strain DSM 11827) TaxID=1109443 RepID=G4TTM7_SERID|nr:SubName: Full=Uncharacterized protein {ECO:0000313/EMBL:CCA74670.1} [Serendipita indica DSM 11827]CCA74670.1 hypothetical protein PIIN_08621 [Serendipita indica DSM 11827]